VTTAAEVLALLDAATTSASWPRDRHHGRRLIAARSGDAWGIAIEQIEGERPGAVLAPRIAVHAFGPKVGKKPITARVLSVVGAPVHPNPFADWIAARLKSKPDGLWGPATACLAALGLPKDATVVAVVGAGPLAGLPSESEDFRALAAAIAD
jgi:hypothetical protein